MLTEIKYKNLIIDNLSRINLICGQNNVGKTDLLQEVCHVCDEFSGAGYKRLQDMMNFIVKNENKTIGIDNFLDGIHKSVLNKKLGQVLATAINFNVQLFVTSHNSDVIKAVADIGDSRIITLVRNVNTDELLCRNISGSEVVSLMREFNFDPRYGVIL